MNRLGRTTMSNLVAARILDDLLIRAMILNEKMAIGSCCAEAHDNWFASNFNSRALWVNF
jgi:hypothetical protein